MEDEQQQLVSSQPNESPLDDERVGSHLGEPLTLPDIVPPGGRGKIKMRKKVRKKSKDVSKQLNSSVNLHEVKHQLAKVHTLQQPRKTERNRASKEGSSSLRRDQSNSLLRNQTQMATYRPPAQPLAHNVVIRDEGTQELVQLIDRHDPLAQFDKDMLVYKHQRRLHEIRQMNVQFGNNFSMNKRPLGQDPNLQQQVSQFRVRNSHFKNQEKKLQIDRENHFMLRRLVDISLGKQGTRTTDSGLGSLISSQKQMNYSSLASSRSVTGRNAFKPSIQSRLSSSNEAVKVIGAGTTTSKKSKGHLTLQEIKEKKRKVSPALENPSLDYGTPAVEKDMNVDLEDEEQPVQSHRSLNNESPEPSKVQKSKDLSSKDHHSLEKSRQQSSSPNTLKVLKSMHIGKKKADLKRIEQDNLKIAKRIYFVEPYIKVKHLEQHFKDHQNASDNLKKIKRRRIPSLAGKTGLLPPIKSISKDSPHHATTTRAKRGGTSMNNHPVFQQPSEDDDIVQEVVVEKKKNRFKKRHQSAKPKRTAAVMSSPVPPEEAVAVTERSGEVQAEGEDQS